MKLIKATKQTGAKRLHRKYVVENREDFTPHLDCECENNVFEFESKDEDDFLQEVEKFKQKQIKEQATQARKENKVKVVDVIVEQGSKEWFEARSGVITASDNPFDTNGNKTPSYYNFVDKKIAEEWRFKNGLAKEEGYKSDAMDNGNELEDNAIEKYEKATGHEVVKKGFLRAVERRIGCSPDGITTDDNFIRRNVEIKSVRLPAYNAELRCRAVTNQYRSQFQTQMYVEDIDFTDLVVICQEDLSLSPIIREVERDEQYICNMVEVLKDFEKDFEVGYSELEKMKEK